MNSFNFRKIFKSKLINLHDNNSRSLIMQGNSLSIMRNIKDNSVDLIFADEPYNIGKNFDGIKDKWPSTKSYIDWNKHWIRQAMRILTTNGTIYIMTATQYMPYIDIYLSQNWNVINRIVWCYDSSGVQSKHHFGSLYEPIIMATKSNKSKYTFNYKDIKIEAKTGAKRKLIDYRKNPPRPYNKKKVPGNVWNYNRVRYRMPEYENHPTQKPEAMLKRIVLASSNKEDLVLDPFSGSFTTSKVAQDLGRNSIGIDLNLQYYKIGLRRLGISKTFHGKKLVKHRKHKAHYKYKHSKIKPKQMTIF